MRSSQADVEAILSDMRLALQQGKKIFVPRSKNMQTLAYLGITQRQAYDEIKTLTYNDYISGPEIDYNYPQSDRLWIFKKAVNGDVVYIKFKVEYMVDGKVRVVSFHLDYMI